jgi:hypothetical protein
MGDNSEDTGHSSNALWQLLLKLKSYLIADLHRRP